MDNFFYHYLLAKERLKVPSHHATGPIAWCNFCHRRHPRRGCDLVQVTETLKAARKHQRPAFADGYWINSSLAPKPRKKAKARKS